jgi:D-inositol-3-phosphate glycosyltransferase
MRIAMVSEHASPLATLGGVDAGGQNVHVAALAAALGRRGHDVTVYTRRDDPDLPTRVPLAAGVVVEHVCAGPAAVLPKDDLLPHMPEFGRHLADVWAANPPDVAHGHFWMSGLAMLKAARGRGAATRRDGSPLPLVQTFHALGEVKRRHQGAKDTSPSTRLRLESELAATVDRVVATCSDEVFELHRIGMPRRRATVVPCGVDTEHFTPDGPSWERGERLRIVSLGRLVERKGVDTLIEGLAGVPGAELVVAGGPPAAELHRDPEAQRLLALAQRVGVADRVRLVGAVSRDDAPALLRSADVVACLPWYEPFGIVPLEAASCGRPVIASAVGGLVDTVVDGSTGLLIPPRDPEAFAEAARDLLADADARRRLGAAARTRATARYTWDRIAAETEAVYQQLAARRAGSRAADDVRRDPTLTDDALTGVGR